MGRISSTLSSRGIANKDNSKYVLICCPFCGDQKFKGSISKYSNFYNCWKCGYHSIGALWARLKMTPIEEHEVEVTQKLVSSVNYIQTALSDSEKKYLVGRGFTPDFLVQKYRISSGGFVGDFAYRVVIPIIENGVVVSLQGRDWTGKQAIRYYSLPIEKSVKSLKDCLYNVDNAGDVCVLVEGLFDVWRLGDGAVCCFGTGVSEAQKDMLKRFRKVIICFDSEEEAQLKAYKLGRELSGLVDVSIVDVESSKDFGDMEQAEADRIKRELMRL